LIAEAEPMERRFASKQPCLTKTLKIIGNTISTMGAITSSVKKEDSDIASTNILESSMDSFQMNAQPKHPSSYASAKRNSSELTPYLPSSEASQYKAGEVKDTPIARTTFLYPPLYTDIDEALLDCLDK